MADDVQIIDFEPQHASAWRELNLAWIRQYWEPEASDYQVLDHPIDNVIVPGGHILLAQRYGDIVGTVALLKMADGGFELAKMSVAESARGQGLGVLLGEAAIDRARALRATRVYLESNSVLKPALALYRKLGFTDISGADSPYNRCNVQMELRLSAQGDNP